MIFFSALSSKDAFFYELWWMGGDEGRLGGAWGSDLLSCLEERRKKLDCSGRLLSSLLLGRWG